MVFVENDEVPLERIFPSPRCLYCGAVIDPISRGCDPTTLTKVRWIGLDKEWTSREPREPFWLLEEGLYVVPRPPNVRGPYLRLVSGGKDVGKT
jgi:hypothetical protein